VGVVAKSTQTRDSRQGDPIRGQVFANTELIVAAALDNEGRTTAFDDVEGGSEPGRASTQDQDGLALLRRPH
jgi:hypothetical protein